MRWHIFGWAVGWLIGWLIAESIIAIMALLKALRGDSSRISTSNTPFHDGYAYLTTDDGGFYIDATTAKGNERIRVNPKAKGRTVTLSVSGWSSNAQTVSVPGVLADQTKQSVKLALADRSSTAAWLAGDVWCEAPTTDNSLTFSCTSVPPSDITLSIELQEVEYAV